MSKFYTSVHVNRNKIFTRGIDTARPDGACDYIRREEFKPTMFSSKGKRGKTIFKNLSDEEVFKIPPRSIQKTRNYLNEQSEISGVRHFGVDDYALQYTCKNHGGIIDYDSSRIRIYNFDIEVESSGGFPDPKDARKPVTAITYYDNIEDTYFTYAINGWENTREDITVIFKEFNSEKDLLLAFLSDWKKNPPHIVTGWNIAGFDIPYLMNRYCRIFGLDVAQEFSPFGVIRERTSRDKFGKEVQRYAIMGVAILDYLHLYQKFTYTNQESYRLDNIAFVELGERKISFEEEGSLLEMYKVNHQKFIDYNIKDVELVKRIDEKMKLIDLAIAMAYDAKINFEDVMGTVKMWDAIIYDYLMTKNIVAPPKKKNTKHEKFEGAFVKNPITGFHDWVVSFDLNSLYPHLIMQYNISPETITDEIDNNVTVDKLLNEEVDTSYLKEINCTLTPNGAHYDRSSRGFLPELMEKIYNERTTYKRKMLDAQQKKESGEDTTNEISKYNNIQMAKKIQLNSAYGAIGNQWFRYYDLRNAEAITTGGQLSIRWIEKALNGFMNKICKTEEYDYVIAIDTDSVYLRMNKIVEHIYKEKDPSKNEIVDFLDKICKESIEPFIDETYQKLADMTNAYEQKMHMGREGISDKGVWTAKKRYALNVYDMEGVRYATPKMKVMGLEIVKSSTPSHVRGKLKEAVNIVLTGTESELHKLVKDYEKEFATLDPVDIAFPRGITDYHKYKNETKRVPIHVNASKLYNRLRKQTGLDHLEKISNGVKIKFIYLKVPNPFRQNVIAFYTGIPPEFGVEEWIDHRTQFEKAFLKPLEGILEPIGWNYKKISTLEDLFA